MSVEPTGSPASDPAMSLPRLMCDEMLGRLARWLRLLGVDTACLKGVDDDAILAAAQREGRVLLTRDVALAARMPGALLVRALEPEAQLREAVQALGLQPDRARLMTRCSLCNAELVRAGRAEAEGHVPEAAFASHEAYWRCPGCRKWYWRGTHAVRIEERLLSPAGDRSP